MKAQVVFELKEYDEFLVRIQEEVVWMLKPTIMNENNWDIPDAVRYAVQKIGKLT